MRLVSFALASAVLVVVALYPSARLLRRPRLRRTGHSRCKGVAHIRSRKRRARRQGLPPLVYNPQLDRMAKIQAENMARFQKMAHVIPESSLPTLTDRARDSGYPMRASRKRRARLPDPETVSRAGWLRRDTAPNILQRDVEETGIGWRDRQRRRLLLQVFGRRMLRCDSSRHTTPRK